MAVEAGPRSDWGVFLFTDVVSSTRLWLEHTSEMADDLAAHDEIIRETLARHHGSEFANAGDSFGAVFDSEAEALQAAVDAQRALATHDWFVPGGISVRMGVHSGPAQSRGFNWFGPTLNEAARLMSSAHGGQIVVSEDVAAVVPDTRVVDLGQHRLRDLQGERRVFQVVDDGLPDDFPPLKSLGAQPSTLPPQRTSLVGRARDVARVGAAIEVHPLVTLMGPGGIGKTRVAVETAARWASAFSDGVFFVDLTTIPTAEGVSAAFLDGIGQAVPPGRTVEQHLQAHLAERAALIVVDNCEHVIDRVAEIVDALLTAAPDVRVLATSRITLDLEGEVLLTLPELDTEGVRSPAAELFVDRALAVNGTLEVGDSDWTTIGEIVRQLDGLPLAIELAAARTRSLSIDDIGRLLVDRFRLLSGKPRAQDRQRTLEGAIQWSYDLLDPAEQRAFRSLSVCAGPFTLRIAQGLLDCDELEAADVLDRLCSQSLVVSMDRESGLRSFRMLESIREFGRMRLEEEGEVEVAHHALEKALVPPSQSEEWTDFVESCAAWDEHLSVEASTRREASWRAFHDGEFLTAAHLFATSHAPDEAGAHDELLEAVTDLDGHRDALDRSARLSVSFAKAALEVFTARYGEMLATVDGVMSELEDDDPARRVFEAWRLLGVGLMDPVGALAHTDALLPSAIESARPPTDFGVSFIATARAMCLAWLADPADALDAARLAVRWAAPGRCDEEISAAAQLWIEYIHGLESDGLLERMNASPVSDGGMLIAPIAAVIASPESIEERAARLVRLAKRRPMGRFLHEESQFLVAFAWLRIEAGDRDRALEIARVCGPRDQATAIALIAAIRELEEWSPNNLGEHLGAALMRYAGPDFFDTLLNDSPRVLTEEIRHWEAATSP